MGYDLEVPVTYKNQELIFNAKFLQLGYSYKFEVDVNGIIFFEPDEERNVRAIIDWIHQLIAGVINLIKN